MPTLIPYSNLIGLLVITGRQHACNLGQSAKGFSPRSLQVGEIKADAIGIHTSPIVNVEVVAQHKQFRSGKGEKRD